MSKDAINPDHYKMYPIEVIDMMVAIFGVQAAINYCIMTAFKYRMRLGHKDEISQELKKEKWYLNKAEELRKEVVKIEFKDYTKMMMDFKIPKDVNPETLK